MIHKIIRKLKSEKSKLVREVMPYWFYRSTFLSGIYYAFFHAGLRRELQAVLAGKVKHLDEARKTKSNYFMLVRNTHRLEKGLLMRPRRDVFASEYIRETVDCYIGVKNGTPEYADESQMKWSKDVLNAYFAVVKSHPIVDAEKAKFLESLGNAVPVNREETLFTPYYRQVSDFSSVTYEEFYKLNRQRRSVRWFLNKPVPRDLIDKAILAAIQAPSACNRQPFSFRILDDPELVDKATALPMGTKGYAYSIQTFIVIVGSLEAYFDERDRHLIYIDASLANMSLMLALETLGLSSCPINWPDIEEREVKMSKFLQLEPYERPIMCIAVGYPDPEGMVAFSEKRSLNKIRRYN